MLLASILGALRSLFKQTTYGSELENYIVYHKPQDTCDVEKLTREFEFMKTNSGFFN